MNIKHLKPGYVVCYAMPWYFMTNELLYEIVCYGMRIQCYGMRFQCFAMIFQCYAMLCYVMVYDVKYMLELTVLRYYPDTNFAQTD